MIWFENKCMYENIAISTCIHFYKHFRMREKKETALITFFFFFYQHEPQRTSLQFISTNISCTSCCKQLICRQWNIFVKHDLDVGVCVRLPVCQASSLLQRIFLLDGVTLLYFIQRQRNKAVCVSCCLL